MSKFRFFAIDHSRGFWTIFCQIPWKSNYWIVRNLQVSAKAIGLNFSSNWASAAFNWVLSIWRIPRIAGLFVSLSQVLFLLGNNRGFSYDVLGTIVKALNNTVFYWLRVLWIMISLRRLSVYAGCKGAVWFSWNCGVNEGELAVTVSITAASPPAYTESLRTLINT